MLSLAGTPLVADIKQDVFGVTADGQTVDRYTLVNENGLSVSVITYGGIITELWVPDRDGKLDDIALGFDSLAEYEKHNSVYYFGCITGRVANRIRDGQFQLDGRIYTLAKNLNGKHHLHGGDVGFHMRIWEAKVLELPSGPSLFLRYESPHGEEGYPGNLTTTVVYRLSHDNALEIEYRATVDQATPINLTNHTYFNLKGHESGSIEDHILTLHARYMTETDTEMIPKGKIVPVAGSPFDFQKPSSIGGRMDRIDIGGYDHNYVLDRGGFPDPGLAAEVYEPGSGRVMEVLTDQPGVQLYTSTYMERVTGKGRAEYRRFQGLCLETQRYPNSINIHQFPSMILRPGEPFQSVTIHRFSTR